MRKHATETSLLGITNFKQLNILIKARVSVLVYTNNMMKDSKRRKIGNRFFMISGVFQSAKRQVVMFRIDDCFLTYVAFSPLFQIGINRSEQL